MEVELPSPVQAWGKERQPTAEAIQSVIKDASWTHAGPHVFPPALQAFQQAAGDGFRAELGALLEGVVPEDQKPVLSALVEHEMLAALEAVLWPQPLTSCHEDDQAHTKDASPAALDCPNGTVEVSAEASVPGTIGSNLSSVSPAQ